MYRYNRGLYDLGEGSRIMVDRGARTWGPPMRLFSPPEVVVINLVPPKAP
jgi:predicted MPP superfamily phosphohydrolase